MCEFIRKLFLSCREMFALKIGKIFITKRNEANSKLTLSENGLRFVFLFFRLTYRNKKNNFQDDKKEEKGNKIITESIVRFTCFWKSLLCGR
jgi:hypothetical protein